MQRLMQMVVLVLESLIVPRSCVVVGDAIYYNAKL